MQSILEQQHYIDPEIFADEQRQIYSKLWIFAGLRTLLAEPDAFLTRTIAGIPIVIQNFAGTLKAFENECAHRQTPLQLEDYGQRRLACRYHGWVYDDQGKVKSILGEHTLYQYPQAERAQLCLHEFALEFLGNLIFVNLSEQPLPIEQQFSAELRQQLTDISGHFSSQVIHTSIPANYNWKLNFENVLDFNHVPFIHPSSFRPLIEDVGAAIKMPVPIVESVDDTKLSDLSFASKMPLKLQKWPWHQMVERYGDSDTYYNFFLYPNVNFISVGGLVFLVQQFDPVAADLTDVRFSLMTAREKQRIGALPAILWGHLKGEKRVLDEDRIVLEALQKQLRSGGRRAAHGAYETQLRRVAHVYRQLMEAA